MPHEFEWKTDDDLSWSTADDADAPLRKASGLRRVWWLLLLVLGVGLLAGWPLAAQMQQRVQEATDNTRNNVRAAHQLVLRALQDGDSELLRATLSGRDLAWTDAQLALVAQKQLLQRPFFGLPDVRETTIADLSLADNLQEAEVTYDVVYGTDDGGMVTLRQTAVYRRGDYRWLLAPPARDFWGEWMSLEQDRLMVAYPARDEALALRLAEDISDTLAVICRRYACAADWQIQIRLDTDPATLAVDLKRLLTDSPQLRLPAPTLLGIPIDDAGYRLVSQAYRRSVAAAVLAEQVGYECCRQGLFFRALLEKQLAELELQPWPLTPKQYQALLLQGSGPDEAGRAWSRPLHDKEAWLPVYALVDFLLAQTGTDVSSLLRALVAERFYDTWLARFWREETSSRSFEEAALAFVIQQADEVRPTAAAAPPDADLQLACQRGEESALLNMRYDFHTGRWTQVALPIRSGYRQPVLSALPNSLGYLAYERPLPDTGQPARLAIWHDRSRQLLLTVPHDENAVWEIVESADPPPGLLLLRQQNFVNGRNRFVLFDLTSCSDSGCAHVEIPSVPVWSPDGTQTLLRRAPDAAALSDFVLRRWRYRLLLGDGMGRQQAQIGAGNSPFWLDGSRYGYVRVVEGDAHEPPQLELVLVDAADDEVQSILSTADLLMALPAAERPHQLVIQRAVVHPQQPQTLIVTAIASFTQLRPSYVFRVTLTPAGTDVADLTLLLAAETGLHTGFSPDGRWLTAANERRNSVWRGSQVYLIDMETEGQHLLSAGKLPPFVPLWTPNGRWFLQYRDDYLMLYAPASGEHAVVRHDFSFCFSPVWLSDGE